MPDAPDADMEKRYALTVAEDEGGARLDKYLTEALGRKFDEDEARHAAEAPSRARVKQLVEEGRVALLGTRPRPR